MPELRMSARLAQYMRPLVPGHPRVFKYGRGDQACWWDVPEDTIVDVEDEADVLSRDVTQPAALRAAARAFLRQQAKRRIPDR